ncbi:MAG: hypothetical protein COA67_06075 [Lutibacter sp.]|nr:MAG: hypothetical protein COA67_06075 [Lutibacter sp.]
MKQLLFILVLTIFVSCNSTSKEEGKSEKKEELVMYNPSELTLLMEEIYTKNEQVKAQILDGELPSAFPEKFLKIHSAVMTEQFERDETFDILADNFVKSQRSIYSSTPETVKKNFNTSINLCVACHQNTCTGPIPRIKKLLIK